MFSFSMDTISLRVLRRKEQERRDASRRRCAALVISPIGGQRCDEDVAACSPTHEPEKSSCAVHQIERSLPIYRKID